MNVVRPLSLPWMALSKASRVAIGGGFAVVLAVLAFGGTLSYRPGDAWVLAAIHGTAIVDALFWASVPAQTLLLAREAHRLRLPLLGREVRFSLVVYAALTIVLPALLLAGLGGHGTDALAEIALGAGLGMAYASLPSWLGVWVCFAPMVSNHLLARWLPMPAASVDGFLLWAAPAALGLWLLIGGFWRSAVRHADGLGGIRRPILLNLRMQAWYGHGAGSHAEARLLRRRAPWLQSSVDLRDSGPGHAFTSLRVALGGWGMPLTLASRLRQVGIGVASLAFVALVFTITTAGGDEATAAVPGGIHLLVIYAGIVGPVCAIAQVQQLQRRWGRTGAELPLLALLPGLGDAGQVRHALLRASLLPALGTQGLVLLGTASLALWLQLDADGWVVLLLGQFFGVGLLLALTFTTLGGVVIRTLWLSLLLMGSLIVISLGSSLVAFGSQPLEASPLMLTGFAVIWAALFTPLLRLGLRGWRGLVRRPHPFLPCS